jgi:hypothetical protein
LSTNSQPKTPAPAQTESFARQIGQMNGKCFGCRFLQTPSQPAGWPVWLHF